MNTPGGQISKGIFTLVGRYAAMPGGTRGRVVADVSMNHVNSATTQSRILYDVLGWQ